MHDTILGIDYGQSKIGLALSAGSMALPYRIIPMSDQLYQAIAEVCTSERVQTIVVGVPFGLSGQSTASVQAVTVFINQLQQHISIPVVTVDERFTSAAVKRHGVGNDDDAHAAALILQTYLDTHEPTSAT